MPGSALPDVCDALVERFAAVEIVGGTVDVVDGPYFNPEGDFLAVGWSDSTNPAPTASSSATDMDFGMSSSDETSEILNLLRIWVGDEDYRDARRRLFGFFDQYQAALAKDYQLDGSALWSFITRCDLTPYLNADGGYLDLLFTVQYRATR